VFPGHGCRPTTPSTYDDDGIAFLDGRLKCVHKFGFVIFEAPLVGIVERRPPRHDTVEQAFFVDTTHLNSAIGDWVFPQLRENHPETAVVPEAELQGPVVIQKPC